MSNPLDHDPPSILKELRLPRRSPVGARPGTINVDPAARPPKIYVSTFNAAEFEHRQVASVDDVPQAPPEGKVLWIDVDGLGDAQVITRIGQMYQLHPLALEDVVNTHQRAKVETYDNCLFIVSRMVTLHERLQTEQISIFLGPNFVITFQERLGDSFAAVSERLRKGVGSLRSTGADHLAYTLLDAVIDSYYPVLEKYGERIEREEERIAKAGPRFSILPIMHIKKDMFLLRKALWPHREMVASLNRDPLPLIADKTRIYLRDLYDHVAQLLDLTETFRELTTDLRDLYMTVISNRVNETMRVLTLIATIFIPLTFIVGIYGMNFDPSVSPYNMPELRWYYGYPFAWGVMLTTLAISLGYYYWRGWLRIDKDIFARRRKKK
jgi:magnesium transporter